MFRRKRHPGDQAHTQGLPQEIAWGTARRALSWNQLWRDIRSAVRALRRERAFAAFAIFLIGLGAGLLTAMFALVDAVTLRKLDVPDPDSLLHIVAMREGRQSPLPYALFERLGENLAVADSLCGTSNNFVPVTYDGQSMTVFTLFAAGDYYRTMGARPLLGRTLTSADDGPVAVISDAYWRRLGKDPAVIGKTIRAGSVPLTIVGVVPANAHELWRFLRSDMVVPFRIGMLLESVPPEKVFRSNVFASARMIKGITLAQVQHRLDALWPRLLAEMIPPGQSLEEWTRTAGAQARVLPGNRGLVWTDNSLARATMALFVLAAMVSLAMCSNLAGLFLSRGLSRQTEYALRMALGATRSDVVRHALSEVLVLSVFGGGAAILLAGWLTRLCSAILLLGSSFENMGLDYGVRVDARVAAFAVAAALTTAVAAQIIPALRFSRVDVGDSLRSGRVTMSSRLGGRKAMLAVQVAAAMVLVSGSVFFVRTLQQLARVDGGFRTEGVLVVKLAGRVPFSEAGPEFFQELLRRVRAIPSVAAAGLADRVPMEWNHDTADPITTSYGGNILEAKSDSGCAWPGFFEALKVPVLAGRDFRESDRDTIILTRELAHRLFPGVDPLGSYVRVGKNPQVQTYQVIGLIGDVRFRSPRQEDTRMFFVPCRQVWKAPQTMYGMTLAVRAAGAPATIESAVRREIDAMGKQAVFQVISLGGLVENSTKNESILASIGTAFGAFTLIFTCVGVYALIDLTAAARRRELGIRMALGADRRMILQLMLQDISSVIGFGACVGLVVTFVVARVYRAFLYGIAELDPLLMSAALAIVVMFALAAALLPAWRAARLEPGSVLRLGV